MKKVMVHRWNNDFYPSLSLGRIYHQIQKDWVAPRGGFKDFLFSPLLGEMIQFDEYFSDGLKPPTSIIYIYSKRCVYVITFSSLQHLCSCNVPNLYTCNVANYPQNFRFFVAPSFLKIPTRMSYRPFRCRSRHRIRSHEPEGI